MIEGIIVKGIGGFYYVKTKEGIYECRARGLFRKTKEKPLVGDRVFIRIDEDKLGYIEKLEPRKNRLTRPEVANIDQGLIIFSIKSPDINLWLLDKFLIISQEQNIDIVICINKSDLSEDMKLDKIVSIYEKIGYRVLKISTDKNSKYYDNISKLKEHLTDKTTALFGPSGVGKSSILNEIQPDLNLKIGDISKKTERGKHTTRHSEIMEIEEINGFVLDTPGFSSIDLDFLTEDDLQEYFIEIHNSSSKCKFIGCKHYKEIGCNVKLDLEKKIISKERYENYIYFLKEILERRKY